MTAVAEARNETQQIANMGQAVVGRGDDALVAVLGSCIGVAMFHPRFRVGALAHVVLPDSHGRTGPPAKFADTAIPYLLELLKSEGVPSTGLIVKLAGGASMFAGNGPMQIGAANLEAIASALVKAGLRATARDIGGSKGRRVSLDCRTGTLSIEIAGASAAEL
jgi:chemotaxis protein CheD